MGVLGAVWKGIRKDKYMSQSESALCQGVILPVLHYYGWDVFNTSEVVPEHGAGNGRVDYCLRTGQVNRVFIEAKRFGENLWAHQEQLLRYSFQEGVPLAILTNGQLWWFYLVLSKGSWEQRKFLSIDVMQQGDERIDNHFKDFLQKDAIISGDAEKKAKSIHSGQTRANEIQQALPLAWQNLIEEQDDVLMELLANKVEGLCGHRPDAETVSLFMFGLAVDDPYKPGNKAFSGKGLERGNEPTFKTSKERQPIRRPMSFTLNGTTYQVRTSREILSLVCEKLWTLNPEGLLEVSVSDMKGIPRFSKDRNILHTPYCIDDSGLFVELNRSSLDIERQCTKLADKLGYTLSIEWEQ